MKRFVASAIVALVALGATATSAAADPGGAPAVHGLSGAEWGKAVSGLAKAGMMPFHK
ncbi:MAG: hypothetical protein IPL43_07850 [Micropruina sp.]|nr:hypothetical protein [Micropruina sp.]